jgi:hypothetical protein
MFRLVSCVSRVRTASRIVLPCCGVAAGGLQSNTTNASPWFWTTTSCRESRKFSKLGASMLARRITFDPSMVHAEPVEIKAICRDIDLHSVRTFLNGTQYVTDLIRVMSEDVEGCWRKVLSSQKNHQSPERNVPGNSGKLRQRANTHRGLT